MAFVLLAQPSMARPLRYVPPGTTVEVTTRTIQSRFLLRPSPELNDVVLGVLGRALSLYAVELHAFAVMSNHMHLLLTPTSGQELAAFMRHVNRNISQEVGRLHDWRGPLWARRYRCIPVVDEASQSQRLRYILAQGCKEGLVVRPAEWPGSTCVRALLEGAPLYGTWLDRSALYEARRRHGDAHADTYKTKYAIALSPLPCWQALTPTDHRHRCAELVADVEREAACHLAETGLPPLGVASILAQRPHDMPRATNRSPAPWVHASTRRARKRFLAAYRRFVTAFRRAADCLRQGMPDVVFPPYAFPPPAPFIAGFG